MFVYKYLIDKLWEKYEIHYLSLQYPMGKPIKVTNKDGKIKYIK